MRSRPLSVGRSDAGCEDRVSEVVAAVIAGARRRAVRDGDQQIDTAHLLHGLLESDPDVREVFPGGSPQVVRLLGYLVQRTIGYGLRWSGTVECAGAARVVGGGMAGWSPAAAGALRAAVHRAASRGASRADGPDLLAALVRDRECRAMEVLRRAGVTVEPLVTALAGENCQQSPG
ncbi:Clp protease N-terminal domain-containing protein [Streptomyces hygroscopicus]|uniref:Clp protease N-terminal domain-containing protein n=1 Tax=Streptomyces hygroscopicus TaxID=1912 RepID=UPI001F3955DE|nr:Clp protease N-terminal domain-containing protein [Streptomyces hygroscopicus]